MINRCGCPVAIQQKVGAESCGRLYWWHLELVESGMANVFSQQHIMVGRCGSGNLCKLLNDAITIKVRRSAYDGDECKNEQGGGYSQPRHHHCTLNNECMKVAV